jgi:hypothetical protein
MKYALVIVESSSVEGPNTQALRDLAAVATGERIQISKAAMLNPGAYLLPLQNGLHGLSALVTEAKDHKLRTRTLFFDQEPAFVISDFDIAPGATSRSH